MAASNATDGDATGGSAIGRLYLMCELIDSDQASGTDGSAGCYSTILDACDDAEPRARMLCFQLICRYLAKFPDQARRSLEAAVKLCRDGDAEVRRYAFKTLRTLVLAAANHPVLVGEMLTLFMKVGDADERAVAEGLMAELLLSRTVEAMQVLAKYSSEVRGIDFRQTAINCIAKQVPVLEKNGKLTEEVEMVIASGLSAALKVVDSDEFVTAVDVMKSLKLCQMESNKRSLFNAIIGEAQLTAAVDVKNANRLEQILCCLRSAKYFASDVVTTNDVVPLLFSQVFSVIVEPPMVNLNLLSDVLRVSVDLVAYCKEIHPADVYIDLLVKMVERRIPTSVSAATSLSDLPDVRMTDVEALLLMLYHLSDKYHDLVIDKLRSIWAPLLQIAQLLESLSSELSLDADAQKNHQELRLQRMALTSAQNVIMILRILKFNDNGPKKAITPSWKKIELTRRGLEMVGDSEFQGRSKLTRQRLQRGAYPRRYQPPIGRYSRNINQYQGTDRNWNNGRQEFRGRGRRRFY